MTELKCSVYVNGERATNQAAAIQVFKDACVASRKAPTLIAVLNAVAAGHLTPEQAAESLGFKSTAQRT